MYAAFYGCLDIAELLLQAGARAELVRDDGVSALLSAAYQGHLEIARLLLKARADKNSARDDGTTPLMVASYHGHPAVVRLLLEAGAEDKADLAGTTALLLGRGLEGGSFHDASRASAFSLVRAPFFV